MLICGVASVTIFNGARGATRDFNAVSIDRPKLADFPEWTGSERVNILLLGIDERQNQSGPWRTDTMLVVTIDPASRTAGLLSIPRDLWVTIPGVSQDGKINTAHFIGDAQQYPGGGPALAMATVQSVLSMPIQYFVRLNFNAFEKLIDLVGGVDITVPETIDDPLYPDSGFGYEPLHIDPGLRHMDGQLALKYARTRHGGAGDFDRMKRQQQVIMAVRDKALQADMLPLLLSQAGALLQTLNDSVKTNLTPDQLIQLARLSAQIDPARIRSIAVEPSMTLALRINSDPPQDALVLKPDVAQLLREELWGQRAAPIAPATAGVRPTVYTVQPGDTLFSVAVRFDVTLEALVDTNNLPSYDIVAGQQLMIP